MKSPLDCVMKSIDGESLDLAKYKGKVVLIVNVASQCGYTGQYEGLQKLYGEHEKEGLVILGVPANDFGKQEPGTDEEIKKFCKTKYAVTFPMTSKVTVKGDGICPLYKYLTEKETNEKCSGAIGWNFEKFLIGRDGKIVGRYKSSVEPNSKELTDAVKKALETK